MRLFCLLLNVLFCANLFAQTPYYAHYGVKEGLPGNVVYCAAQDQRGFMWFGTDKGLVRFDGVRFQTFGIKDGLPDPEVLGMFFDSHNRLWLSFLRQKPYYMENGRVITAKEDTLLNLINLKSEICEFAEDNDHRIWIMGRNETAFIYDGKSIAKKNYPQGIIQIWNDGNAILGLGFFTLMHEDHIVAKFQKEQIIFKSLDFSGDNILYSYTNKLMLLNARKNGEILRTLPIDCGRVDTDRHGRFWAFPTTGSAICFDNAEHDITEPKWYLKDKIINAMYNDVSGTYWFCTNGDGIYALPPGKGVTINKTDGLSSNNITALAFDDKGHLIAGDNLGNIYTSEGDTVQKVHLPIPERFNRTRQIIAVPNDGYWVANDLKLIHVVHNKVSIQPKFLGLKGLLINEDKIWAATHAYCGYIGRNPEDTLKRLVNRRTTTIGSDSEHQIWIGGVEGVYNLKDTFRFNWGERYPLLKTRIVTIQNAGNNQLWIATPESGLLRATVKNSEIIQLERINQFLKHPIDNIQAVFVDPKNGQKVWLATNSGVYGINTADWQVTHIDQQDGLADNDVNCVLVNLDTLWAGTVSGISFFPLNQKATLTAFPTHIAGLSYQIENQNISIGLLDSLNNHITIVPAGALMVTLNLSGLEYGSQGNFAYSCIIRRMMPALRWWTRNNIYHWISSQFVGSADTTMLQSNFLNFGITLPPGAYEVDITAITAQGVKSNIPDSWKLIMLPHWYETIWFDLFIWVIIGYAVWRFLKARSEYRKLNIQVSELQLRALQTQINPHFIGNSINTIHQFFYPLDRRGLSKYIQLFTQLLRRTITLSEQHFNRFEEELAYDRDYLDMIKTRFKEQFSYQIEGADTISPKMLFPSMLLQPILENATIHGLSPEGNSHLMLAFSYKNTLFSCSITDNGIGFNASKARVSHGKSTHKSKGLELISKKIEAFNQLYNLGLNMTITDLADENPSGRGTRVEIIFYPENIALYETHKNTAGR